MQFFKLMFLFSLGKYPVVKLLDHIVILFLIFWATCVLFSTVATPIYIPINSDRGSFFFISSSVLAGSCVFYFSHSDRCETISHCSLDLHFFDDEWCWASFHVSVGHLYVFFGQMSVHVVCLFLNWIIWFLGIELYQFFLYFGF